MTRLLQGGAFPALESTVLLDCIPGHYKPSITLGLVSTEPQKAIRGKGDKVINTADGRLTRTGMKKGNRGHAH